MADPRRATPQPVSVALRAALALTVVVSSVVAFVLYAPPAVAPASAAPDAFSAARAMEHVRVIARQPHPTGSEEHARVRAYLTQTLEGLGLEVEVQEADVAELSRGQEVGAIANVIGIRRGAQRGGAVLVATHYDSVPWAPGAGDDGAAVGAALETARILAGGPALARDVVFLFTDAEELGLHGARLFVDRHPLAAEVAVVMNFEARGSRGPSIMFETASGNAWFIEQLAAVAPSPVASSLAGEVYERMPNDTDFSVFLRAGYRGYNFAFIEGLRHYHTPEDTVSNLDPRSVQHHGESMLSLARHLASRPVHEVFPDLGDEVYFNLSGLAFVHYRERWVWWLEALALVAAVVALAAAARRGVRLGPGLAGLGLQLGTMVASAAVTGVLFRVVYAIDPRFSDGHAALDNPWYKASFVALALAIALGVTGVLQRRVAGEALLAGQLVGWCLGSVALTWAAPGGSFLFVWPVVALALGLGFYPALTAGHARALLSALPLVGSLLVLALLWVPTLVASYQALTLALTPLMGALVALVGCVAAVPLCIAAAERARWLPLASLGASLVFAALA